MEIKNDSSENHLRSSIEILEKRILIMVAIRDHMKMLLPNHGKHSKASQQRSNSIGKQLITDLILDELQKSVYLPTQELFDRIQTSAPALKYTTFRSYLHRLKEQGLVANETGANGGWQIAKAHRKQS